jgi:nickel-type superoxide dismutase maturation protease
MPTGRRTAVAVALAWGAVWLVNRSLVAVRGPSMLPTLAPGDRLLTVPVLLARPAPGRVVVVEDPTEPGHLVVKRVEEADAATLVVLGDHPDASTDSRAWGPLPHGAVRRVAVARWPRLSRTGLR